MKKIIVIDPDKKFWKDVEKVVNTDICEVIFLENGNPLMGKLKEDNFDLIILNLELPDKNGFVYCNQIKKDANLKNIPVIITSSEKTEEDFEQHKKLKVRAEEYLRKPISISTLKNTIASFLPDIIVEEKPQKTKAEEKANIKVDDFDEENIDKLLDETFVGLIEEEPKTKPTKTEKSENDLQKKIDSLIEENMSLKQQIEELQRGNSTEKILSEENEKLKEKIEEIEKQLNQKKEEVKELNVQIIALQKEKGFFEKENRDILMNITTLKADFEEKLSEQSKLIDTLKQEKESIEGQLNSLKSQIEEKNKFIEAIQSENAELKDRVSVLTEKTENMSGEISNLNEEKTKMENQLIEQNKMIETLQRDLSISQEAKNALEETIFQLKEESTKTKNDLQTTLRENEILKAQLFEAEEKAKKLEEKISRITVKIKELKEEAEK